MDSVALRWSQRSFAAQQNGYSTISMELDVLGLPQGFATCQITTSLRARLAINLSLDGGSVLTHTSHPSLAVRLHVARALHRYSPTGAFPGH
jgi:hypothetical protein